MCLSFSIMNQKRPTDIFCGYKVVIKQGSGWVGMYYPKIDEGYQINKEYISNRNELELSSSELRHGEVYKGIHLIRSLKDAEHVLYYQRTGGIPGYYRILKCKALPEDWVASGQWKYSRTKIIMSAVVYRKVTPFQILGG